MENAIIVIAGPTASGKTDLAVELAKKFGGEIINADSRTIYREMDIATSKPKLSRHPEGTKDPGLDSSALPQNDEGGNYSTNNVLYYDGIPHHLFDIVNPDESFTLSDYQKMAKEKIVEIQSRGNIPFLVGGTGLYIDAVVYDFNLADSEPDPAVRKDLESLTAEELFEKLVDLDPVTADNIDKNNKRRLLRALEVILTTKKSFYESKEKKDLPKNVLYLALNVSRENLIENINKRIDNWLKEGLVEETKELIAKYSLELPSMSSIGYAEIATFLSEEITIDEALELMKIRTRQYAKKQMTWFRKNQDILWIKNPHEAEVAINKLLKLN